MPEIKRRCLWHKRLCVALFLLTVFTACEVDMSVAIDGGNPPTFDLEGSGYLLTLSVMEVPPENQIRSMDRSSDQNIMLWRIRPPTRGNAIHSLPAITYGKLPDGFTQLFPANNASPATLTGGKIYEVGGAAYEANGGSIWIKIVGGKAVVVPMP